MKEDLKFIVVSLGVVASVVLLIYGGYAFLSPKYAEVRNQTFKNSTAYNDGMANDLSMMQMEYIAATDPDVKAALGATIKQRFAAYPKERLPAELREFYFSL